MVEAPYGGVVAVIYCPNSSRALRECGLEPLEKLGRVSKYLGSKSRLGMVKVSIDL